MLIIMSNLKNYSLNINKKEKKKDFLKFFLSKFQTVVANCFGFSSKQKYCHLHFFKSAS